MAVPSFVWRPRSKMVAIVDLTLSVIGVVIIIVFAVLAAIAVAVVTVITTAVENGNGGGSGAGGGTSQLSVNGSKVDTVQLWLIWVGVAISVALTLIQIWAGFKLLKSTDLRKTPSEALSCVKFWFYLSLILLLITVPMNIVIYQMYVVTIIGLIIRVALMLIVFQYMSELKTAINTQTISKVAPI